MTRTRHLVASAAVVVLAVLTAGCGAAASNGAGSGSTPAVTASSGHRVVIQGFAFHPSTLTVPVGTTVTFVNEDSVAHTATATASGGFNSGNLDKGQTFTHTFTKAGTYNYICNIHQYMKATIVVTG